MNAKLSFIIRISIIGLVLAVLLSTGQANAGPTPRDPLAPNAGTVTITETGGSTDVTESGGSDTYSVVLDSAPIADVTISFNTGSQIAAISSIVFTILNWNVAQDVTVNAVDDAVAEGAHTGTISHAASSLDPNYDGISIPSVTANITDNDATPTVNFTLSSQSVAESAGSATITAELSNPSSSAVSVPFSVSVSSTATSGSDFTISASPLSIPAGSTSANITITIIDDNTDEADETVIVNMGTPTNANIGTTTSHTATITDNDAAGVTINESNSSTNVTEGGATDSYTLVLNSQPSNNVTISFNTGTQIAAISPVTFTNMNWNSFQTITVTAVDDPVIEGPHTGSISHSASSADPNYNGANISIASVTPNITDNDVAGILVSPISGLVTTEFAGTDTFTVTLTSQPSSNVSINLSSSDTTEGTVSPSVLTFTQLTWNSIKTVTVTGVDDDMVDGPVDYAILTAPATSGDVNFNGVNADNVTVTNADNDTAGFTVSPTTGLVTGEGGRKAVFKVVLNTQPAANVTMNIESNDLSEGTVTPSVITFTPTNWNSLVTITVTGVDDLLVDGDVKYKIRMTSTSGDTDYHGKTLLATVTNLDAPTIEWVSPAGDNGVYENYETDPILLKVRRKSKEEAVLVRFYRWDAVNGEYVTIGEVGPAPFELYLYPHELHLDFNQLFAVAYDSRGSYSPHIWIWIRRVGYRTYLPFMTRKK